MWRRSACGNFPLEPFACGLASKNAYDHAQRLVAAIVRRAPRCSASSPSMALRSRSDHNAAAPSEWSICASQAEQFGGWTYGHHVIAGDSAQPRPCQARSRVSGRSEAEWLDWAEDRRQSVVVMAASVGHQVAQRENLPDERDARVGRQAGGDGR